jgi:hypothetical protein
MFFQFCFFIFSVFSLLIYMSRKFSMTFREKTQVRCDAKVFFIRTRRWPSERFGFRGSLAFFSAQQPLLDLLSLQSNSRFSDFVLHYVFFGKVSANCPHMEKVCNSVSEERLGLFYEVLATKCVVFNMLPHLMGKSQYACLGFLTARRVVKVVRAL